MVSNRGIVESDACRLAIWLRFPKKYISKSLLIQENNSFCGNFPGFIYFEVCVIGYANGMTCFSSKNYPATSKKNFKIVKVT